MTASIANASVSITSVSTSLNGDLTRQSYNGTDYFALEAWAGDEGDYLAGTFSGSGTITYKVTYSGPVSGRPSTASISNLVNYEATAAVRIDQGSDGFHDTGDARIDYGPSSMLLATIDRYESPYHFTREGDNHTLSQTLISSGTFSSENGQWVAYVSFNVPFMFVSATATSYDGNRGTANVQTTFTVQSVTGT